MSVISKTARLRAPETCVEISWFYRFFDVTSRGRRHRKLPHIKDLSPHLARDAGISNAELAQHHHIWPSETARHPRH